MRHRVSRQRLTQKPAHARMLKRNLVTSLFLYETVRTTKQRARVLAPMVDRLVSIAKKSAPHVAIRRLNQTLTDKNASKKVMEVLTKRYANRPSGLTTVKPAGVRKGDGAELVDITLMDAEIGKVAVPSVEKEEKKAPAKKSAAKKESKEEAKESTTEES